MFFHSTAPSEQCCAFFQPDSQQPASLPAPHLTVRPHSPWRSAAKAAQLLPLPLLAGSLLYRRGARIWFPFPRGLGGWCAPMFPISNWSLHHSRPTVAIKTFFFETPCIHGSVAGLPILRGRCKVVPYAGVSLVAARSSPNRVSSDQENRELFSTNREFLKSESNWQKNISF